VASALVVVAALGSAAHLYPLAVSLPFLIASSLGHRFGSSAMQAVVTDGELTLDGKKIDDIRDVWLEDDSDEPRVVVAHGEARKLAVLWFENRVQAKRFANEFPDRKELVAGHRPSFVSLLAPLRFVAIAAAFLTHGSWYGGLALLFVPLGLRGFFAGKQLVVHGDTFELRTAFDAETFRREGIEKVDIDDGIITMKERELHFTSSESRDVHLAAPPWADAIRRRALRRLAQPPPRDHTPGGGIG
jgi:hypothetical protein